MRVAAQGATGRTILAGCRPFFDRHGFARQCRLVNVQVASLEELSISRHFSLVSSGWVVRCFYCRRDNTSPIRNAATKPVALRVAVEPQDSPDIDVN